MKSNISGKMRLFLVAAVLLVITSVSGCTTSSGISLGPGVVITGWEPDLSEVHSGDTLKLLLKVQNTGEVDAKNVKAELTGINIEKWKYYGSLFLKEDLGSLMRADKDSNTPGQTRQLEFKLEAPKLPEGIEQLYTPKVRVSYDYSTKAVKQITIVDKDELIRIKQMGGSLPEGVTSYTQGPISVAITTKPYVKTSGVGTFAGRTFDIFPVNIKITNIGSGFVTSEDYGLWIYGYDDYLYPVRIKITPPEGTSFVWSGSTLYNDCAGDIVRDLWKGQDTEVSCELQVTNPPSISDQRMILVNVDYRYAIDQTTQVKVIGVEDSGFWY